MRLKEYGDSIEFSSLLGLGGHEREYWNGDFEKLLNRVKNILNHKDFYYAVFDFKKHGRLKATFKINPATVKHTIYIEKYSINPQVPIDKMTFVCTKSCKKDQLIDKLIELHNEYLK